MADVGYARVSKREQHLDLQLDALASAGCDPIFADKLSGADDERPQLAEALRAVQAGDTFTAWRLDRVGRSLPHLLAFVEDLQRRGVQFRSLTEHISTEGATGRLVFHVLAAIAEFERELIVERTTAGLEAARARGRVGGPPPYGLAADGSIVEAEAAVLREGGRRALAGEPLAKIVDDLNERGIRPRHADRWHVTTLRRQLTNPRAVPILGEDVHARLAGLFHGPDRKRLGRPVNHLGSGILRCGRDGCGRPMYAARFQERNGGARLVYKCKKAAGSGGRFSGCGRIVISLPRADGWLQEAFVAAVCGPKLARHVAAQLEALHAGGPTPEQLAAERQEIAELEQIRGTRFFMAEHRDRLVELQARARDAAARLRARPDLEALASLPRTEAELRAAWADWTVPERRAWLRRVLHHVTVKPAPPGTHHRGSDVGARLDPLWRV